MRAEEGDAEGAKRKQIVAYDKVFQIKDIRAFAKRLEARPEVESEDAREREDEEEDRRGNG